MKILNFVKSSLLLLTSVVLICIGCSSEQKILNSKNNQADASTSDKTVDRQVITPTTQTGEARMSLNTMTTPLKAGKNTLMLSITDAKNGKPLTVKNLGVEMFMSEEEMKAMGMPEMGALTAKTQVKAAKSPGMFEIHTSLPHEGNWQLKVNIKDMQSANSAIFNIVAK